MTTTERRRLCCRSGHLAVQVRANPVIGKLKQEQSPAVHGAPRIILTGGTWFGDVKILHQRMWERFLTRR